MSTWLNGDIQPQYRAVDGLSIRFAESEDRDDHALLLSPWPESLYAFEPTWLRLAEEHALLVAIDLPGFVGPDVGTAASLFAAALES